MSWRCSVCREAAAHTGDRNCRAHYIGCLRTVTCARVSGVARVCAAQRDATVGSAVRAARALAMAGAVWVEALQGQQSQHHGVDRAQGCNDEKDDAHNQDSVARGGRKRVRVEKAVCRPNQQREEGEKLSSKAADMPATNARVRREKLLHRCAPRRTATPFPAAGHRCPCLLPQLQTPHACSSPLATAAQARAWRRGAASAAQRSAPTVRG
jgi:hypothetical protein